METSLNALYMVRTAPAKTFRRYFKVRNQVCVQGVDDAATRQDDAQTVSWWTIAGRIKGVRFPCSADALKVLQ